MCASSRPIQDALQIGRKAELYQREHNLEAAVDTFRSALSLLVPLLGSEPKGVRKDMLHKQVGVRSDVKRNVFLVTLINIFLPTDLRLDARGGTLQGIARDETAFHLLGHTNSANRRRRATIISRHLIITECLQQLFHTIVT